MPLWRVYSDPAVFTVAQRAALAADVTALYVGIGLPPFYVNVLFVDTPANQLYIGGEPRADFVRVVAEQIARQLPSAETAEGAAMRRGWMERIVAVSLISDEFPVCCLRLTPSIW